MTRDSRGGSRLIDGSDASPFPPPPPTWRPSGLTRSEESAVELALWDRVRRTAEVRGCSVRIAAEIVAGELRGAVR